MPCIWHGCRAFIFPCCNKAPYKRLQRLLSCPCSYTANAVKQRTELYSGVSCDCSHSAANDTRPIQSTITPLAPRWSVSQRRSASSTCQNHRNAKKLHRSAQPQTMQARRGQRLHLYEVSPAAVSMLPTSGGLQSGTGSAVRAGTLAPYTRRSSPAGAAQRAARNH